MNEGFLATLLSSLTTLLSSLTIIGFFVYFIKQAYKVWQIYSTLNGIKLEKDDLLVQLSKSPFAELSNAYSDTLNYETPSGRKTNTPASEFFTEFSMYRIKKLNLRLLDTASGTLVGLGLLGTFLGLTLGIEGFDSSSTENIQKSIQGLLTGMGTAFFTSLLGMGLSIVFIFFDKSWRNRLTKIVRNLTERLDTLYYIDDVNLSMLLQKQMLDALSAEIKKVIQSVDEKLTYTQDDNIVTIGNAIREIVGENREQSKALKSFSTDLALELNNGFDEVLSRQMQEKIVPLMENVDTTTRMIVEHVDQLSSVVASPATDMLQVVVQELKTSMAAMVDEFKSGLSGSATSELENLALSLGSATQAMANFPQNMENISNTLQVTIDEVKTAVSEISNTSANANSTAMQQMQEQITMATTAMGNAIEQVKEVMSGMTTTSQEQSSKMIGKLSEAADKMGMFLNETVSSLSSNVQLTVKNMAEEVSEKQASLMEVQENSIAQTRTLLQTFNEGLDRLERMNEYIAGTMNQFQQAQGQISGTTAHLQTLTGDMKLATELFNKGQSSYATSVSSLQNSTQKSIDSVTNLLRNSGELSSQYVAEFDTIKQGLSAIFAEIQRGLTEYSRTVKASTQEYLDKYSTSLTNTTDKLSSAIQQQSEVVEMLVDSMNSRK